MPTLNVDLDYQVKVIGKTLTLLKQKDIILNSMTQTREKWDSLVFSRGDFWMIWRYHGILYIHFYFLFRNNVWREQLDKNNFCYCYSIFFLKMLFRKYLITAMFGVLSQQLRGTLTTAFERHLTIEDFTDMDVKPAPRHLTYYCMLLIFSNMPKFKLKLIL